MRTATILILMVTRRAADGVIGVVGLHRLHCGILVDRVAAADVLTGVGVV